MRNEASLEAQKQWNAKACGELEGDKGTTEYFVKVEEDRYKQQSWMHDYFQYDKYEGKKVLEIGVGQGTDLMQFAKSGAACYGVDITDNHLLLTQRKFKLLGKKVHLIKVDAVQLPFSDNYLDCVYSFGVMHHIPEVEKVIAEAYRVLKPGGVFMFALYYKWSAFHLFWKLFAHGLRHRWLFTKGYDGLLATIEDGADGVTIKPYVKLYTKKDVKRLLSKFVVKDISVHQLHPDHLWPPMLSKLMEKWVLNLEQRLGWYVACKAIKANNSTLIDGE